MSDKNYVSAKKRVEAKLGFYAHLTIYIAVSLLLIAINLYSSPDKLWFPWPLAGWAIGVIFHGLGVFLLSDGTARKERMIQKEMDK